MTEEVRIIDGELRRIADSLEILALIAVARETREQEISRITARQHLDNAIDRASNIP
jgi:hypothetical protein